MRDNVLPSKPSYEELLSRIRVLEKDQEELIKSKNELDQMFSMFLDMICVVDMKTASFLKVNQAFTTTLGYSEEELLGKPIFDFIHPDDIKPTRSVIEKKLQSGTKVVNFENRYRCKGGGYKWLSWMSRPNIEKSLSYAVARDITRIKQAENSLRESEERYKGLFNSTNDGICLHEIIYNNNEPVDYRILDTNPKYEELTGIKRIDARGALASRLYKTGEAPYLGIYADAARTGEPVSFETYFPPMEKHFLITVFSPAAHQFATVFQDITERKQAEDELKEKVQLYNTIGDAIPYGVWVADEAGLWTFASSSFLGMTGATTEEIQGLGWLCFLPEEDRESTRNHWLHCVQTGRDYKREKRFRSSDGAYRHVLAIGTPLRREDGTVLKWVGLNLDITEQKKMENELRNSEKRLRTSLSEKEVLLKEVHHRVKNNMQVISSLVDLQAVEFQDPSIRAIFKEVIFRVRSMAMVHEKLYQSTDLARVDFGDYTRSLLGYLWRAQGAPAHRIELKLDLGPVFLPVNEAVPCGLILNELFTNSLKHAFVGRDSGTVTVSLSNNAQGKVCLTVQDNGIGLPPEMDIKKARTLGLRLVQMLSGQLCASLEVESDKGTKFAVAFDAPES